MRANRLSLILAPFSPTHVARAAPALSDFNAHLSNSSYPRVLDAARFRAAIRIAPTFFRAGGWMPLAGEYEFSSLSLSLGDLVVAVVRAMVVTSPSCGTRPVWIADFPFHL